MLVTWSLLSGCSAPPPPVDVVTISGAGSTFAEPIIKRWAEEYHKRNPQVRIVYEGVGSGEGEKRFLTEKVDFGGTDAGLRADQLAAVPRGAVQVPITAGIVVLAYNAEGLPADLHLPREVYVDVLLGKGIRWSDPRIQAANSGQPLPDKDITVVVRQDSSGTTFALTNHLAAVSSEWRDRFGNKNAKDELELGVKTLNWPGAPLRAPGNSGVAGMIKRTPYSIGYVQYGAAREIDLPMAMLENKAGNFVQAAGTSGLETLLNAQLPPDLRGYFPDPEGEYSYPIVTFTWVLVFHEYPEPGKGKQVRDFFRWCLTRGQDYSEAVGNVRLAPHVIRAAERALGPVGGSLPSTQHSASASIPNSTFAITKTSSAHSTPLRR
jgi:phosphate transport system substrate-binding protein